MKTHFDQMGAVASTVCAVHCAICGALPFVFSALGLSFLAGHGAEWAFSVVAIVFAVGASLVGWRQHRSANVVGLLVLGVVGLLASRGLEAGLGHHDHHVDHHGEHHNEHGEDRDVDGDRTAGKSDAHIAHHVDHPSGDRASDGSLSGAEGDMGHLVGTVVGVLAGLMLLLGHLLNIRASRRTLMGV